MITRQQVQAAFVSRREIGTDWQEGVISSVSPLRVAIGKHVVDATPSTLVTPSLLTVGMPVWCQHQPTSGSTGGRLLILGIIGGTPDTGWQALTLTAPYTDAGGAHQIRLRRQGDQVWIHGALTDTGVTATTAHVVATIPAAFRPAIDRRVACASTTAANNGVWLFGGGGNLTLITAASVGGFYYLNHSWWTS